MDELQKAQIELLQVKSQAYDQITAMQNQMKQIDQNTVNLLNKIVAALKLEGQVSDEDIVNRIHQLVKLETANANTKTKTARKTTASRKAD